VVDALVRRLALHGVTRYGLYYAYTHAGFYNTGWFGGSIPAAAITFGTNYIDNNYSWRVPLILQCFACVFVIFAVFFVPESPRWLMANGKDEEATAFLIKYHGNGNPQSRLVLLEIEEMREGIRQDGIDKTNFNCEYIISSGLAFK
jgi:MFS family permease